MTSKSVNSQKTALLLAMSAAAITVFFHAAAARAAILFQNDDFATIESTNIILNSDDEGTGNVTLQFGSTLNESLKWNSAASRFEFSDDLDLTNNQLTTARMENVTAMPGGGGGLGAGGTGRVVELTATDSIAPGCTGPSCTPGTYSWNGAIWKPLQGNITTSNATKIVTVGPVGRDYTTISAAAAYLNTLSGGEMWVDPGTYPVITTVDLENVRVVGTDLSQTTVSITGTGKFLVKDTKFKDATINISAAITAAMGLDVKFNALSNSTVEFDQTDFIVGAGKVALDSSAGTPPVTIAQFINTTESSGAGTLVAAITPSNLSASSNFLVVDQLGLSALKFVDWNVTIVGGSNVVTSGTINTVPDRTIFVSPGMNINTAITSLGVSGGVVKLLIGTHDVTNEININSDNIELIGEGPGTILRAQTAGWLGGTTADNCVIQVGLANGTSPRTNVITRNFKVQAGPNIHGICVNGGTENKVIDMIVQSIGAKTNIGGPRTGIVFTDGSAAAGTRFTASRNIINNDITVNRWVDGVHFDGNADIPPQLYGYGNGITDSIISEVIVSEARETSYAFSQVSASSVFSNRARNIGFVAGAQGMFFNDAQDVMIINNTMEGANAAATGIRLFDNVDNSVVMGNAVRGGPISYSTGINITGATNAGNIVTNNQFNSVTVTVADTGTNTKLETLHHRATANPAATDDINDGYGVGTVWINTSTNVSFILLDSTAGAALWLQLAYNQAQAAPPATCSASFAGRTFMDTDSGITYVCDTSNGRNKWLALTDLSLFGEETGSCAAGDNPGDSATCNVDWGAALGPDTGTDLGLYIPFPVTITGYGFSEDNDACSSGSFDVEVWTTPDNTNDNAFSLAATPGAGLTGQAHNANNLNIDLPGNQYVLFGIDNNCGQSIDDFNIVIYYRYRHA